MRTLKTKNTVSRFIALLVCFCMLLSTADTGVLASYTGAQIENYIDKTYEYEKNGGSKVLSDTEAKTALTESTDLLMLASGRDVGRTAVTDDEFSLYLGYVNVNLRKGNGTYKAEDFLRAALAVGAAGGDPTSVGKDVNGNRVDLLYKGVYARSLATLEKDGAKTVAYALLVLDANDISDNEIYFSGSKVTRVQLKKSLVTFANTLAEQAFPDVSTSALVLSALSPYYCAGESDAVSASNRLLGKIGSMQTADGLLDDSTVATADVIVALCSMNIDPVGNTYFSEDLVSGLLRNYNGDGGFSPNSASASSAVSATASARCALVACNCYDQAGLFYDFSSVKSHSVKNIPTSSSNSGSSSNKNTSSSSSNKNTSSSSTNKSTSSSSSSNKSTNKNINSSSSAGNNTRSITAEPSESKIIEKSVFEDLKGKDENYLYESTWGESEAYTISFHGKDITEPMDFNAEISPIVTHQMEIDAAADEAEYISFLHNGAFPGKATATVTVSVADGSYQCYRYDEVQGSFVEVSAVTVSGGMVTFDLDTGGDYFITSAEVAAEQIAMSMEDAVDGIVPASVFENIMGKNSELVLSGETERGVRYEITFNGADIESPMDFNMEITETTAYWERISKLAKQPLVLHFEHDGALPGVASVKFYANLEDGVNYALFYYNPAEEIGVYSSAIDVGDGEFTFTLSHCSDYFIAEFTGETLLDGGSNVWSILLIVFGILLLLAAVAFVVLLRIYGKEGMKVQAKVLMEKAKGLFAVVKEKIGSKKASTGKNRRKKENDEDVAAEELFVDEEISDDEVFDNEELSDGEYSADAEDDRPYEEYDFVENGNTDCLVEDSDVTAKEDHIETDSEESSSKYSEEDAEKE